MKIPDSNFAMAKLQWQFRRDYDAWFEHGTIKRDEYLLKKTAYELACIVERGKPDFNPLMERPIHRWCDVHDFDHLPDYEVVQEFINSDNDPLYISRSVEYIRMNAPPPPPPSSPPPPSPPPPPRRSSSRPRKARKKTRYIFE
jgi:hypothetical protein